MVSPDSDFRYHPEPESLPPINGDVRGKDVVSLKQFTSQDIDQLFQSTNEMAKIAKEARPSDILAGKIVVLLFYEPSSRTRASFDAAVKQLGGQTVVVENPQQFSSVAKGETFEDTIRVFEAYSDAIVLRHPEIGSAQKAAEIAKSVPIINAGDGIGEHPTQALLDMYTIWEKTGSLSGLRGLMAGDLLNGRTIHSLTWGLALYPGNEIFLLSPEQLRLSRQDIRDFTNRGVKIHEIESMDDVPSDLNFWYWTRVQKERFANENEYHALNNKFVVDLETLNRYASPDTILMHPLPRVGEIKEEVDGDPRAVYLRNQIRNGMYVRMELLKRILVG